MSQFDNDDHLPNAACLVTKRQMRISCTFVAITSTMLLGAAIAYVLLGHRIINGAYYKNSPLPLVNRLFNNRGGVAVEYYHNKVNRLFVDATMMVIAAQVLGLILILRAGAVALVRGFFNQATSPYNLAIFRIVLFGMFLRQVDPDLVTWFNSLPKELRHAPRGLDAIVSHLPAGIEPAKTACIALSVACLAAMIGFRARASALAAAILGLYVLGIPNFYGKVSHYHHLIWFAAILAASPGGDVLSVDVAISAWRRRRSGLAPTRVLPSRIYSVPLRWVWLLIGIIYFFPGFWKLWKFGPEWLAGDYFPLVLRTKWFELEGWTPLLRVDRYPMAYRFLAATAILFELSFPFLVLGRWTRPLIALAGQAFHAGTMFLMQISFYSLQASYVAFVDWAGLFKRLGFVNAQGTSPADQAPNHRSSLAVHLVGGALFLGNAILGFACVEDGWPLACYPTFAYPYGPEVSKLEIVVTSPSGGSTLLDDRALSRRIGSDRWAGLMRSLLAGQSPERMRMIWRVMTTETKAIDKISRVEIYRSTYVSDPDCATRSCPLRRTRILEFGP
jgi:hypothetical protein